MRRIHWVTIEKLVLYRIVTMTFLFLLLFVCDSIVAYAQSGSSGGERSVSFVTNTTTDPWFWVSISAWVFSALVAGMPEPEVDDSPWYIWAYRSLHIISGSGTAYFQHKYLWLTKTQLEQLRSQTGRDK